MKHLKYFKFLALIGLTFSISYFVFQKRNDFFSSKKTVSKKTRQLNNSENRSIELGRLNFTPTKNAENFQKHVDKQWALQDISILQAWKETTGTKNIVIAVVDTGIHTLHPCLKNNLWINKNEIPNNNKDDDNNGFVDDVHGWNFVNNNNNIQDKHGHGTHIAGLIAATGKTSEDSDCQVIGVAPQVSLMVLKYYDDENNSNNVINTIKSIEYAINNGAHIINYSGGGPGANENEKSLIAQAADKDIIFISASGNDSTEIGKKTKYYPASYELPNIIYVQSKNEKNEIIDSSNWVTTDYRETKIYQTAPGDSIISTLPPRRFLRGQLINNIMRTIARIETNHNNYGFMTGTSQATAVATGVAALVKSRFPHWSMEQIVNQVYKTGFGQGTEKIQQKTKEGKKLNALKALIMRDQNVDFADSVDHSNAILPATNKADTLNNLQKLRGRVDIYDPSTTHSKGSGTLTPIGKNLLRKKKK